MKKQKQAKKRKEDMYGIPDNRCLTGIVVGRLTSQGVRNYPILQVLLQTGMRLDECSHLNLGDIEFGERGGRVTIRHGKGDKTRTVPLNASACQALAEYVAPRFACDPTIKAGAVQ